MARQYVEPAAYEAKLEKVMTRLTYWCPCSKGGGEWRANVRGTEVKGREIDRLVAYEDTGLEPEEICDLLTQHRTEYCESADFDCCELGAYRRTGLMPERASELARAESEGRLVVLPCKVGDTVYQTDGIRTYASTIKNVIYETDSIAFDGRAIGESIFLTHEEAERALKGGPSE